MQPSDSTTDTLLSPYLGFGLGLRTPHYEQVLQEQPDVDWFEVLSENYMVAGGKPRYYLEAIGERYPLVMHGVSMSIGSTDPLNMEYLRSLKALANAVNPRWISDHICWTSIHGVNSHDLLPLPYTWETVRHVAERVKQVQDFLGRRLLLENVSSYLSYRNSEMNEWEFLNAVCDEADCLILLDVNNIYVSARNHGFDPLEYLDVVNPRRVQQIHLAGHSDYGDYVIDTHDHDVPNAVWDLYRETLKRLGPVSSMIERDGNIPAFDALYDELGQARTIADEVLGVQAIPASKRHQIASAQQIAQEVARV
ncbi:MAG: DUF692 domain-containing protein [Oceanobacter sp.]|jgi:uncharacterized protein (UPF0276 family)